jgi:predicted transcriptional regulator
MDKTVKDIAILLENYPHIQETQTLHDGVQVIQSFTHGENNHLKYSELLVINDRNQLVGRLNLQDILQGLDKRLVAVPKPKGFEGKGAEYPNLAILWEGSFYLECSKKASRPISDFMSPAQRYVKGSDPLLVALSIMLYAHDFLLPVVEEKRVIGVIRIEEIFTAISSQCKL